MREFFKKLLQAYFIIVTCTLFSSALFITIFNHGAKVSSGFLWQVLLFSLGATLTMFILYSKKELSKSALIIRKILHYISLNILLISLGIYWGWFSIDYMFQIFVIVINVAVVYAIVEALLCFSNIKQAERFNEKIKEYKSQRTIDN